MFTNYPTKPGRLWRLTKGFETLVYEASKAAYDLYGVAFRGVVIFTFTALIPARFLVYL